MKTDARTKKRENETLYILKVWATFSVIAIHFGFLGQIGVFYKVLARFAVPLFFMISGFYSFSISEEKLKKRIKNLSLLIISSTSFYFLLDVFLQLTQGNLRVVFERFTFNNIFNFLVFNQISALIGSLATPLWFLYALLHVYIYLFFSNKKWIFNTILTVIILCCSFIIELKANSALFYRNFLFMGVPFFSFGMYFAQIQRKIINYKHFKELFIIGIMISGFLTLIEYTFLGANFELYVSSVIISCMLMVFSIKYPQLWTLDFAVNIAKKNATFIYISHQFVILLFKTYVRDGIAYKIGTFLIFLACVIMSIIFNYIVDIISRCCIKEKQDII